MKILDKKNEKKALDYRACSNAQLWDAFRNGDKKAFAYIYTTQLPLLSKYAVVLSHDKGFIEDSIDEVFEDIFRHRETLGSVRNISGYLFESLRHKMFRNRKNTQLEICSMMPITLRK